MVSKDQNGASTKYVYGNGLLGQENANGYYSCHYDMCGSTIALTNGSGTVTDTYAYDIYGSVTKKTGTNTVIFLYNGRDGVITDTNGLLYMRERYYSPELKRFINADVITGTIHQSTTSNRYAYVEGNPISYIDPFGLSAEPGSGWGNAGHTLLDTLGYISGLGELFDGANAVWYWIAGDKVNAAFSASALMPVIGDAAGAGKLVKKYGDKVIETIGKYGGDVAKWMDDTLRGFGKTELEFVLLGGGRFKLADDALNEKIKNP